MMSGDPSEMLGARRLSVPVSPRRYSTLGVPGAPGAGARRLSTLGVPGGAPALAGGAGGAGRRLSALVPESVVRRLSNVSNTLGLGRPSEKDSLVEQGKTICALYMRSRIRLAGAAAGTNAEARAACCAQLAQPWAGARTVFPRISHLGRLLERSKPRLYSALARHAALATEPDAPDAPDLVYGIGVELFKDDITWGKVVSLMAVCGALAIEPRATPDLSGVVEAAAAIIRGPLLSWLSDHGGWYGIVEHCHPEEDSISQHPVRLLSVYITLSFVGVALLLGLMWSLIRDLVLIGN